MMRHLIQQLRTTTAPARGLVGERYRAPALQVSILIGLSLAVVLTLSLPTSLAPWMALVAIYLAFASHPATTASAWLVMVAIVSATPHQSGLIVAWIALFLGGLVLALVSHYSATALLQRMARGAMAAMTTWLALGIARFTGTIPVWSLIAAGAGTAIVVTLLEATSPIHRSRRWSFRALHTLMVERAMYGVGAVIAGYALASPAGTIAYLGWIIPIGALVGLGAIVAADAARNELDRTRSEAIDSWLMLIEAKDLYTRGHSERVAGYAATLGRLVGLRESDLHHLEHAALLHDVGKVVVPRFLIRKPAPLTELEAVILDRHTRVLAELLGDIDLFEPVVPLIEEHHCYFDGTGPGGRGADNFGGFLLRKGTPSIAARIIAIADAYDAMTTHRPYRAAMTIEHACVELRRCAGTQFDPALVEQWIAWIAEEVNDRPMGIVKVNSPQEVRHG